MSEPWNDRSFALSVFARLQASKNLEREHLHADEARALLVHGFASTAFFWDEPGLRTSWALGGDVRKVNNVKGYYVTELKVPPIEEEILDLRGVSNPARPPLTKAAGFLKKAAELVGVDRETSHGPKKRNHDNIASLWQAYLGNRFDPDAPLTAHDVALMMALLKIARTQLGNFNADDYVDLAGYAGCAAEIRTATHFQPAVK